MTRGPDSNQKIRFDFKVGRRLRKKRKEQNINLRKLQEISGVCMCNVSQYEKGSGMTLFNFMRLCKALEISSDDVLGLWEE